ncbi:mediator of RNA polymerase II transcription subunit 18-like isoform X2 [Lineus longissimus]|uniref:mediator of RNA polymerase II transcription subunit 18-like isoform X2 n=1 Tax=Lineus longissimus TaxID=88925 RepID=UPI002B4DB877
MDITGPGIIPDQEYLLQGSILETSRDVLLHRLRGLCDNLETGPEMFHDHEMVYCMRGAGPPVLFRARRSLSHQHVPWHLRYVGQVDVGDKSRATLLRSCIDVSTSDNLMQFLVEMGFKLDHEHVVKGYLFTKGRMKITVSKIFRMLESNNTETIEPLSQSYLVELSIVTTPGQEQVQDDMRNFAEQLKPLVQLDKIDHRRLQVQQI